MTLYTFGYEGCTIDDFIARLLMADVRIVLDVRELPLSRKRGFSKRGFAEALGLAGIGYTHLPALGCPKSIRTRYKRDGDWSAYCKSFGSYLSGQSDAVSRLVQTARKSPVCLVCFEADYTRCHRSIVASAAARVGELQVVHLRARTATPAETLQAAA
jgi:uncharacterized protein (DUF488 family)